MVMLEAIGKAAMLELLAEEAAELAQAALKAARIERGENPTPVTQGEARKHLIEEYTDVWQCATELGLSIDCDQVTRKEKRFCDRIMARNSSKLKDNISGENAEIPESQKPKKILYRKQRYGTPYLCPVCESDQVKVEFFNADGSPVKENSHTVGNAGRSWIGNDIKECRMKVKELKEYLSKWPENEHIHFLAVKPKDRIAWPSDQIGVIAITGSEAPVVGLGLGKAEPMDEEMIRAAEEDEAAAGWIPVTEKLPKEDAWVLVMVKRHHWISDFGNENVPDDERTDHPERIYYTLGRCLMRDSWEYLDIESDVENPCVSATNDCRKENLSYPMAEALAWMPLPEPYREV